LKYSLVVVGDRGPGKAMLASSRLLSEVMYIETQDKWYPPSLFLSLSPSHTRTCSRYELSTVRADSPGEAMYRLSRVMHPQDPIASGPLPTDRSVIIADRLQWGELCWGAGSLTVRGDVLQPSCVFWRRRQDAALAAS
jgi:hypothetical protein